MKLFNRCRICQKVLILKDRDACDLHSHLVAMDDSLLHLIDQIEGSLDRVCGLISENRLRRVRCHGEPS